MYASYAGGEQRTARFLLAACRTLAVALSDAAEKPPATEKIDELRSVDAPASPRKLSLAFPHGRSRLHSLNRSKTNLKSLLTNTSDQDLVLWPLLTVDLQNADDKPVKKTLNIGRYGLRTSDSIIEGVPFAVVKAGQAHSIDINIKQYTYGDGFIYGWRLSVAGKYRAVLHYKYDAAEARKTYGRGCKTLNDPNRPWNQAHEVALKQTVEFTVR